ncbi:MAG TPA: T9SS type A sorting domain-containing protein, partial [Bacteroidia bacterium]|nr:T9SS type A sorting domain-containing protein [Bacteroidia bacterium]
PKPFLGIYQGIQISSDSISCRYCRFSYAYIAMSYASGNATKIPIAHCLFVSNRLGINAQISTGPIMTIDTCTFKYDTIGISWTLVNLMGCEFIKNGKGIECGSTNSTQVSYGSSYYSLFENNSYGIYSPPSKYGIAFCTFDSNKCGIVSLWIDTLRNCNIWHNNVGLTSNGTSIITSNNISNNYIGMIVYNINDVVSCNSICNNSHYSIMSQTSGNDNFRNNYWCLKDSASIQATIYDSYQNISEGFIFFTLFDTVPCPSVFTAINQATVNKETIKLFPNPNNGNFTIELSSIIDNAEVEVYNMLGKKIYAMRFNSENIPIDISSDASGIYLYRVLSGTGALISEGKFIYTH